MNTLAAPEWDELWSSLRLLAAFRPGVGAELGGTWSVRARGGLAEVVAGEHPDAVLVSSGIGRVFALRAPADAARKLFELYAPLCHPLCSPAASAASSSAASAASPSLSPDGGAAQRAGSFAVAHLGQSLDGRIGPLNGNPEAITGPEDMTHNHRMRALFDVVLVGGGTVLHDNPTLTVRHVEGRNPVRVVVDPERRLSRFLRHLQRRPGADACCSVARSCARPARATARPRCWAFRTPADRAPCSRRCGARVCRVSSSRVAA